MYLDREITHSKYFEMETSILKELRHCQVDVHS